MRPSLLLFGLALAAGMGLPARSARAAGLPALVVHRTEDVADCPDARALAHRVAEQMKRPALEPVAEIPPGAPPGLDVQIYRSEQGFTAIIQAGGKTRQLSDKGSTCGGLAVALAVSIAVLLDTEPLPPAPEPPKPAESAAPAVASSSLPLPPEATPLPPPVEEPATPPPRRVRVTLAASPVITVGLLQGFAGGVTSELEVRVSRFTVSGGVFVLPGETVDNSGRPYKLELTSGLIRACGIVAGDEPMRLVLCAEPMGGSLRGEGLGFVKNWVSNRPWAAASTTAFFQQRIWGPLSWGARAGLVIPLTKNSFTVDNMPVFSAAPVGGAWNLELRVSIW